MPSTSDISNALTAAEAAAAAGDFAGAADRLRQAASLQEASLGAQHPDLAETLNNLGIVCEKIGALDEAERHYRRAYAIAKSALEPGHPFVATSRENLREFCQANGLVFEAKPVAAARAPAPIAVPPRPAPTPVRHLPPLQSSPRSPVRSLAIGGTIVAAVVLIMFVANRPRSDSAAAPGAVSTTAPSASAPVPTPAPAPPATPPAASASSTRAARAVPVLVNARLCTTLKTGRVDWECDRAPSPVAAGSLTFYTRLRSNRDATVQHRWYRGTDLVQTADLRIRANLGPGYRTYSRFTVDRGGDWRVELRAGDGSVLHEERFIVR